MSYEERDLLDMCDPMGDIGGQDHNIGAAEDAAEWAAHVAAENAASFAGLAATEPKSTPCPRCRRLLGPGEAGVAARAGCCARCSYGAPCRGCEAHV